TGMLPQAVGARQGFAHGMRVGLGNALTGDGPLFTCTGLEIKHVKKLQGNEAAVIVRHRTPDGKFLKLRWWVSKRTGAWRIYDFEDLDMTVRVTTVAAGAGGLPPDEFVELGRAM